MAAELDGAPEDFELLCRFFCIPGAREQVEPLARFMFASLRDRPGLRHLLPLAGLRRAIDEMCEAWAAKDRDAAMAAAPWDLIEEMFILGTPDEMRARLDEFVAGGITLPVLPRSPRPTGWAR